MARLIETLTLGSVGESTRKEYLGEWRPWIKERGRRNLGLWLLRVGVIDSAIKEPTKFMASRCLIQKSQSITI